MKTEKVDILKIELEGQEAIDFKKALTKIVDENAKAEINDKIK